MEKIRYILAIETCSEHLGVCLLDAETQKCIKKEEMAYRKLSDNIHPFVDDVMNESDITFQDIGLLACTRGPGSFTSVRVGMSAIKGYRIAMNVDAVTLPSLELIALPYLGNDKPVTVWLEAHGGNVYTQTFNADGSVLVEAVSMKAEEAGKNVPEGAILVGSGIMKHAECVPEHAEVIESTLTDETEQNRSRFGCVETLAKEALKRHGAQTEDVNNFQALYVHPLNYDKVGAV